MYIFAEPVSEAQVAHIQGQNDAKIQEFERNILGLNRESAQENQDDDGKWEDIQANVQAAMDEDEFSVDDPSRVSYPDETASSGVEDQVVSNQGPLYTNQAADTQDRESENASPDSEDSDLIMGNDQNSEADDGEARAGVVAQKGDTALQCETHDDRGSDNLPDPINAAGVDSDVREDAVDEAHQRLNENTEENSSSPPDFESREVLENYQEEDDMSSGTEKAIEQTPDSAIQDRGRVTAEKAEYVPPVPGEELSDSEYQLHADQPFLDIIDQETSVPQVEAEETASGLLAMTLTLRNRLNGKYVLRPEKMAPEDVWTVDYSLVEVPNERRARALYEACQKRREKKLDSHEVPEDAEVISQYLKNLRDLSIRGRNWRKEMDEKDRKSPPKVLGRETIAFRGEDLADQDLNG